MNTVNIWKREPKKKGVKITAAAFKFPPQYTAALKELAKRESERLGKPISQATIIMNLTMEGANEYRPKQAELKSIYLKLNKENRREHQAQQEAQST